MVEFGNQALTLCLEIDQRAINTWVHCGLSNRKLGVNWGHFLKDQKDKPLVDDSEKYQNHEWDRPTSDKCVSSVLQSPLSCMDTGTSCYALGRCSQGSGWCEERSFSVGAYHCKPASGEQRKSEIYTTILRHVILPASQVQRIVDSPPLIYLTTGFFWIY